MNIFHIKVKYLIPDKSVESLVAEKLKLKF